MTRRKQDREENVMKTITPPPIKARELLGGTDPSFDTDTGIGRIRYVPTEALLNPAGTVLGGYLSAMLDDVASLVTWYGCGERWFATAQMSTWFLRGAKQDEALIGKAMVTGTGKRQAFIEALLIRESGDTIVAKATLVQTFLDGGEKQ